MRLVTLAESGLGIAEEEILRLFEPFVDRAASARAWQAEVGRRKRKLVKRLAKRLLMPWRGDGRCGEATVVGEYDKAWRAIDYGVYALGAPRRSATIPPGGGASGRCSRAISAPPASASCC